MCVVSVCLCVPMCVFRFMKFANIIRKVVNARHSSLGLHESLNIGYCWISLDLCNLKFQGLGCQPQIYLLAMFDLLLYNELLISIVFSISLAYIS